MVDFFLLLMIAGAGDELQGIKKGVLEVADAIAINKADGDNVERANMARKQIESALHYLMPPSPTWSPRALTCSSLNPEDAGIKAIWSTVLEHREAIRNSGELDAKRRRQAVDWMWSLVEEGLKMRFYKHPEIKSRLGKITRHVAAGEMAPTVAADELLFSLDNKETV
jgi:LAO/AO transport system kinase